MSIPYHLLIDSGLRDIPAWNKWRHRNRGKLIDLSGGDFRFADLSNADLDHADLSHADLTGARMRETSLYGARMVSAVLVDADLSDADARCADMFAVDLTDATLNGAELDGADLRCADMDGASLDGATLRGVVGVNRDDICVTGAVGYWGHCSAIRYRDGSIRIWAGPETFESIAGFRKEIDRRCGPRAAECNAWLDWVAARLEKP
jgi:uncharacterized protein YjbI with pentapeptide repeats